MRQQTISYCPGCEAPIPDPQAAFCPDCGRALQGAGQTPESVLVDLARQGDSAAISELYERSYSKVYYSVKAMIKDEDAVFDILQDSYLKAFTFLRTSAAEIRFLPWMRTIAANTARNWLKKQKPLLFSELGGEDDEAAPFEERLADERAGVLPEQVLEQNETKRLLREIIDELPEDQRAVIGMFYYEELTVRQIAEAMGVSENTVKSRLSYGRAKIEKKVRALEKQGTRLYGLAPIPFLLWLLRGIQRGGTEAASPALSISSPF